MSDEEASEQYWKAVGILQEVIDSGHRDSKESVLAELDNDLS